MRRDSVGGTIMVAAVLCVVCSVIVSVAAVGLKPTQEKNARLDKQRNVLAAAGKLMPEDSDEQVAEKFKTMIDRQIVNLDTGDIASEEELKEAGINPEDYDQEGARSKTSMNREIPKGALPGFTKTEKYSEVYVVKSPEGQVEGVVLPIYGKGLWSTLKGFIALQSDTKTAKGLTFYSHGETPGLGGEVDNPNWKAQWPGKKVRDDEGNVLIEVKKAGNVSDEKTQVDGLSGATITTNGVNNLVRFWLSDEGFGPYLNNLESKEKSDG
ncbi:Na(+)-translocating NADH-quinone reductase subunit C [Bremerella cremea]|uniref:Na(+)-translocating NADH-quinone reductase subunit C n=1 Tax=Bremerella cremea TaxID=1031537 RepID=UPI0031ED9218